MNEPTMKSSFSAETIMGNAFVVRESRRSCLHQEEEDAEARPHDAMLLSFPMIPTLSCDVCKKRFGFAKKALQCRECNYRFHQECATGKPCLPKMIIPKTPFVSSSLAAYCPQKHPFIPALLFHCVYALDRYFLDTEGLYRLSGMSSAVKKLYSEFMKESNRIPPELSPDVDPKNITGCVKLFLNNLNGSLIPENCYDDFLYAINSNSEQEIITTVFELPPPHRDTLAFLLLHLQKVAKHSNQNKMTVENLAPILAPTIIGHAKTESNDMEEEFSITSNKVTILKSLLNLSPRFWQSFMEENMSNVYPSRSSMFNSSPTTPQSKKNFYYNGTSKEECSTPSSFVRKSFNVLSSKVRGWGFNSSY